MFFYLKEKVFKRNGVMCNGNRWSSGFFKKMYCISLLYCIVFLFFYFSFFFFADWFDKVIVQEVSISFVSINCSKKFLRCNFFLPSISYKFSCSC